MTKIVLLIDDLKADLRLDTAYELEPEEADGLMFSGVLFFCRHHTEKAIEAGTPVFAYHTVSMFDPERLVLAITKAREKRAEMAAQAKDSAEPTVKFNMDAWKDVFASGESKTQE